MAKFMGPSWGPSGADRTQMGNMLAPWGGHFDSQGVIHRMSFIKGNH